jgi:hypothetical protein
VAKKFSGTFHQIFVNAFDFDMRASNEEINQNMKAKYDLSDQKLGDLDLQQRNCVATNNHFLKISRFNENFGVSFLTNIC